MLDNFRSAAAFRLSGWAVLALAIGDKASDAAHWAASVVACVVIAAALWLENLRH